MLFHNGYSQESSGGVPISFQNTPTSLKRIPNQDVITLPEVDNEVEQQRADSIAAITCTDCDNKYYCILSPIDCHVHCCSCHLIRREF